MRESIYLDELLLKIKENREIGEIMGNAMEEIAKSCKRHTEQDTDKLLKQLREVTVERHGNVGMGGELVVNFDDIVDIIKANKQSCTGATGKEK